MECSIREVSYLTNIVGKGIAEKIFEGLQLAPRAKARASLPGDPNNLNATLRDHFPAGRYNTGNSVPFRSVEAGQAERHIGRSA